MYLIWIQKTIVKDQHRLKGFQVARLKVSFLNIYRVQKTLKYLPRHP